MAYHDVVWHGVLTMARVLLSRSFSVGLLAYLRQASLSLDRGGGPQWPGLKRYLMSGSRPSAVEVCRRLNAAVGPELEEGTIDSDEAWRLWNSRWYCFKARWYARLRSMFTPTIALPPGQARFMLSALTEFHRLLGVGDDVQQARLNAVRLDLVAAEALIRVRIPNRRRLLAVDRVEHFNHAEHLRLVSISEIVGADWPGSG